MFPPETRFLLVDDMPSLREMLKIILNKAGFKAISEANDGQEAYQVLLAAKSAGKPIEVIICDWNMPNMTGIDFLKVVRAVDEWKDLPFVLLTTENEKHKVISAIQAGVTNYIVKPIEEKTVVEKLKGVWEKVKK